MNIMKILSSTILLLIALNCLSQNNSACKKYFSLGSETAGICFGHSKYYNGIRLNLMDRELIDGDLLTSKINGIAISFINECNIVNGFQIGLLASHTMRINGLAMGVLTDIESINGISISLFRQHSKKQKGLAISVINKTDELKGVQIGLLNYVGNNPKLFRCLPFLNFHL